MRQSISCKHSLSGRILPAMLAVLTSLVISCTKDGGFGSSSVSEDAAYVTFDAALDAGTTKTCLAGTKVCWELTDSVSLWYGTPGTSTSREEYFVHSVNASDARVATLKGWATESDAYIGVYPSCAARSCSADGTVTVSLPLKQEIRQGGFGHNANVALAYSGTTELPFKNVGGLLAFVVKSAAGHTIKEIRLTGTAAMSGEAEVTRASFPAITRTLDANNYVVLDCGEGLEDYDGMFGSNETFGDDTGAWGTKAGMMTKAGGYAGPGQTYYLVSLPGSHTGFVLTLVDSEGRTAVARSTHAFTVTRNSNTLIAGISAPADPGKWKTDPKVYINEVDCTAKKIELYNPNSEAVDLSGWVLANGEDRWAFPLDSGIPAKGCLVVNCNQADCSTGPMFDLSGDKGFDIRLSNGTLVDHVDNLTAVTAIATGETKGDCPQG